MAGRRAPENDHTGKRRHRPRPHAKILPQHLSSSMTARALPVHAEQPGLSTAGRPVRPFLKWAGGKRQILPYLREFYPESFAVYREPFLGSGAVFFDLVNQKL